MPPANAKKIDGALTSFRKYENFIDNWFDYKQHIQ